MIRLRQTDPKDTLVTKTHIERAYTNLRTGLFRLEAQGNAFLWLQLQSKNVALHTPALIKQHALAVYQQTAVLKLMPMNNATQITDDERAVIKRWYESGAPAN
mgnify:CR=1 FL=1